MPTDLNTQSEPTQYANYAGRTGEMYCENAVLYDGAETAFDADCGTGQVGYKWPSAIALAGAVLATAFLLAFLTLSMVRATDQVEVTPTPVIHSVTTVPADPESVDRPGGGQQGTQTITIAPTSQRPETTTVRPAPDRNATITVTTTEPPPATMTNPLEPPPATMTNPLEPPPATMTNPLEPPPATMTNPLEPPIGTPGESVD